MNEKIDTLLEDARPSLTEEERNGMFAQIEVGIAKPIPSPYSVFIHTRTMTTLLIALMVLAGTSGTVLASESAKPGDLLFPIERISEQARLTIATNAKKEDLRKQYAEERLAELREIIAEEKTETDTKVAATTTEGFISVTADGEVRITDATEVLLDYIDDVREDDKKENLLRELLGELRAVKVAGRGEGNLNVWNDDTRLHIKEDRIDLKEDGYRVRIENDGEIKIKGDGGWDDSRHDDDDSDDSDDDGGRDNSSSVKAEIDTNVIRTDIKIGRDDWDEEDNDSHDERLRVREFEVKVERSWAEVKVKYDGKEIEYKTPYTTKAALIAEVALKTGLATADLESALRMEVED